MNAWVLFIIAVILFILLIAISVLFISKKISEMTVAQNETIYKIKEELQNETRLGSKQMLDERRQVLEVVNKANSMMQKESERISNQFSDVQKGIGEMKGLAGEVGSLKKILSNVKRRGILGETQLENILSDVLSPSQYKKDVAIKENSRENVEFAIVLPGKDEEVLIAIDSKFPAEMYEQLLNAYSGGDKNEIKMHQDKFVKALKNEGKSISSKYINPPVTTDFAMMFLPFEGLYQEAITLGVAEMLQKEYNIVVAGPITMFAILNSFLIGFKTLEVDRKSSEVWRALNEVKTEFSKFEEALSKTAKHLDTATKSLNDLRTTRTNQLARKLDAIEEVDD